ncbi:flagellar filament capping protein FliD [Massilia sp. 9096]|uniref:flagellar filament capping protein FliD n=1 Tax=Massilia sp. 9096 TaxID=1500894 RepID=UPI00056BE5F1|nr:flagellar filament capping protein FliD [Massilia sp. 9096]
MGISTPGIGSGLDVGGLVSKLMAAESIPLQTYDSKTNSLQNQIAAYGQLSGAIGTFQGALSSLSQASTFQALTSTPGDKSILTAATTSTAVPGNYKISVNQLAQAQSLNTPGQASVSALIGSGAGATLTFEFGSVSGGNFGINGGTLAARAATSGIPKGSLSINGATIATDSTTRSAQDLADAINAQSDTTGVTATPGPATTAADLFGSAGATTFGNVQTDASSSYALSVAGVKIATQGAGVAAGSGVTAASIDDTLGADNTTTQALAAAGITFSGKASDGTLKFTSADGSDLDVTETVTGGVTGGVHNNGTANTGSTAVASGGVNLTSSDGSPITIAGSNPALAGFTAGTGGSYSGAGFALDGAQTISTVNIDPGNQTLSGIRDAINKANIGVTASIVSDGSDKPYHLVLASTKTGANANMKIMVGGAGGADADPALSSLLSYDPSGVQALQQTSAAQDTLVNVNGIAVKSHTKDVADAISGVTITAAQTGSTSLTVARDTASVTTAINGFVKAYNTLNSTISGLTAYNPDTKQAGALQGDFTARSIQTQLRAALGNAVQGLDGMTTLSQIGVSFQKDGTLAVDSTKLNTAMTNNFSDIAGLFAAVGQASDGQISVAKSSAKTQAGNYAVNITQMATQSTLTGANPLAATTTIGANTTWSVTLNQTDPTTASKVQNIAIPAGSYSPAELAAVLRSAINGDSDFASSGDTVAASIDATGHLALSSTKWGSGSNLSVDSVTGTGPDVVFGGAKADAGKDVAGTIGGVQATGNGQTLSGAVASPTEGLQLTINGGAAGDRGDINFSQGYAVLLNNLSTGFIGTGGLITGRTDGLNTSIKSIATQKSDFQDHLNDLQKMYTTQFNSLDTMLSSMQSTQSYLTQQLASIAANSAA